MRSDATSRPRLSAAQTVFFRREGYLPFHEPVLGSERFAALRAHWENKINSLAAEPRPQAFFQAHFCDMKLFDWLLCDEILDLVEPILGPDIALFTSHFFCKHALSGQRAPWHEDSAYWKGMLSPMEVCAVSLAITPARRDNGCLNVIPRTHDNGYSHYALVDADKNILPAEIVPAQRQSSKAVPLELDANEASLRDGRLMHGSEANPTERPRWNFDMFYMSTRVKFNAQRHGQWHQIYLARGRDLAGNSYGEPGRRYDNPARYSARYLDVMRLRVLSGLEAPAN